MQCYRCKSVIEGPVTAVYDALTTPAGLQGWWTKTCEVGRRVGTISIFRFGKSYNMMAIERLAPSSEVRWRCLEQYHHAPGQFKRNDEWVGTTLIFRPTQPTPGRTELEFEHAGLAPHFECYAISEQSWDHFLGRSLKQYVEQGRGEPFL